MLIKDYVKKFIFLLLILILVLNNILYARDRITERQEFDMPEAEDSNNNISESTIIYENSYKEYSPLNPYPIGYNKEEIDSVDNFNIDFNTIETRIKLFSPSYLAIKKSAESSFWMSFYARGGSMQNMYLFRDEQKEYLDTALSYRDLKNENSVKLNELKKIKNPDKKTEEEIENLKLAVYTYNLAYDSYMLAYNTALSSVSSLMSSLGYRKTLTSIADVDKNNSVTYARDVVTNTLKGLILSYLQVEDYIKVLEEQEKLFKNMYETYKRNYDEGISTILEVTTNLNNYEAAKNSRKALKTTYDNLKEQICINLGYDLSDIDKLNFVEPEIDMEYISNINIDDDRDKAYNSNSVYNSITLSSKDRIFPGSTGENLFKSRQKATAEKIIVQLEDLYEKLNAAILTYQGCEYLKEECVLNDAANQRKKDNNLVSDVEYLGLYVSNLAKKLEVKKAKYDLIKATNDYYYATLGQITIS